MRRVSIGGVIAAAALVLSFVVPVGAQTAGKAGKSTPPPGMPEKVYVADFAIEAGGTAQEGRLLRRPRVLQEDPGAKAAKLVDLLSSSLVAELKNRSVPAQRLDTGAPAPSGGWLVKGEFLEVDQGNRLRRAAIGFGAGASEMQIEVAVIDLSKGTGEPFLVFGTKSSSGKGPGAVVMMNPYAAAAKFVLSKRASEKDVRKTAREIAAVLVKTMESTGTAPK